MKVNEQTIENNLHALLVRLRRGCLRWRERRLQGAVRSGTCRRNRGMTRWTARRCQSRNEARAPRRQHRGSGCCRQRTRRGRRC
jgi:hypothetical protein